MDVRVKVTHEPSGMETKAYFSWSLVKSRNACFAMLRGKLWSLEHGVEQPAATDAQRAIADRILQGRHG